MPDELTPATPADIEQSLHYALRFGRDGKALGTRMRANPALMSSWLTEHLLRSNFVVLCRVPPPEPIGRCGQPP
jgi:hypothetical protein